MTAATNMRGRADVDAVRQAPALRDPHSVARLLRLEVARGTSRSARVVRVLCPWHSESSPSCNLEQKGGYLVAHCQACKGGGDVLSLLAAVEGLDAKAQFPAVLERAAELAGVELQPRSGPRLVRKPRMPGDDLREARLEVGKLRREVDHLRGLLEEVAVERIMERGIWRGMLDGAHEALEEARILAAPLRSAAEDLAIDAASCGRAGDGALVWDLEGAGGGSR